MLHKVLRASACAHSPTHTQMHSHTHTQRHTHTPKGTHTQMHPHTHTHTKAHALKRWARCAWNIGCINLSRIIIPEIIIPSVALWWEQLFSLLAQINFNLVSCRAMTNAKVEQHWAQRLRGREITGDFWVLKAWVRISMRLGVCWRSTHRLRCFVGRLFLKLSIK